MLTSTATPPAHILTPEQVVRELRHLPSAPKVLPRLKRLLSNANTAISEIVELIRLDPGIAARVLQSSNSAYYSKGTRCSTVDEAVNRVGFNQVYELVAYAVSSQVLVRPLAAYGIEQDEMWRSAVTCGFAAEKLAEFTGEDRDIAYTVGLLHSVGMIVIDEWVLRNRPRRKITGHSFPNEFCEEERALLGFTQAEAGACLLRHWDFAPSMSEPVRWQYLPRSTAGHQRMACLLHTAKWVRSVVCAAEGAPVPAIPDEWLLQPLHLGPKQLDACVEEVKSKFTATTILLDSAPEPVEEIQFPGGTHKISSAPDRPGRF